MRKGAFKPQRRPAPPVEERQSKPAVPWEDLDLPEQFRAAAIERARVDAEIKALEERKRDLGKALEGFLEAADEEKVSIDGVGVVTRIFSQSTKLDRQKLIKLVGVEPVERCTTVTPYSYVKVTPEGEEG